MKPSINLNSKWYTTSTSWNYASKTEKGTSEFWSTPTRPTTRLTKSISIPPVSTPKTRPPKKWKSKSCIDPCPVTSASKPFWPSCTTVWPVKCLTFLANSIWWTSLTHRLTSMKTLWPRTLMCWISFSRTRTRSRPTATLIISNIWEAWPLPPVPNRSCGSSLKMLRRLDPPFLPCLETCSRLPDRPEFRRITTTEITGNYIRNI